MKPAIICVVLTLILREGASISVGFTHDFNTGTHGWTLGDWKWTGNSSSPNLTNVPSFHSHGNYTWTQKAVPSQRRYFLSPITKGVRNDTAFTVRYWFSTSNASETTAMEVYMTETRKLDFTVNVVVKDSVADWRDLVFDCRKSNCCLSYPCDTQIAIRSWVGGSDGDGLVAVQCVSTQPHGCADSHVAAQKGESTLTFQPNQLVVVFFVLAAIVHNYPLSF